MKYTVEYTCDRRFIVHVDADNRSDARIKADAILDKVFPVSEEQFSNSGVDVEYTYFGCETVHEEAK